jgi:hypothetical protein
MDALNTNISDARIETTQPTFTAFRLAATLPPPEVKGLAYFFFAAVCARSRSSCSRISGVMLAPKSSVSKTWRSSTSPSPLSFRSRAPASRRALYQALL